MPTQIQYELMHAGTRKQVLDGTDVKVGLSPSKKNGFMCFNEASLKMMKNDFYYLKNPICS